MKVGVLGAGAVGAYVGCLMQQRAADCEVVLVGRQTFEDQVNRGGLVLDTVGTAHGRVHIAREDLEVTQDVDKLRGCDVVLVACKSTGTALAAKQLAALARAGGLADGALILSLQNGVSNGQVLAAELRPLGVCVLPCMVNFNVVWSSYCDPAADALRIRRCTPPKFGLPCIRVQDLPSPTSSSEADASSATRRRGRRKEREESEEGEEEEEEEADPAAAAAAASRLRLNLTRTVRALKAGGALRVSLTDNIRDVLYSKLLVNLQSAVNALSGEPVPDMLSKRGYRMAWRGLILEALRVYRAAGVRPRAPYVPVLPFLLALPDWCFALLSERLFPLDPGCKSSMLQDVEAGRRTEIAALNGEIVRLARLNDARSKETRGGRGRGRGREGGAEKRAGGGAGGGAEGGAEGGAGGGSGGGSGGAVGGSDGPSDGEERGDSDASVGSCERVDDDLLTQTRDFVGGAATEEPWTEEFTWNGVCTRFKVVRAVVLHGVRRGGAALSARWSALIGGPFGGGGGGGRGAPLNAAAVELVLRLEQGRIQGGRMEADHLWETMQDMAFGDSTAR